MSSDDLERLLIEHTDAWNSHDLDRLMRLFADDCVFDASGGPEPYGSRFGGRTGTAGAVLAGGLARLLLWFLGRTPGRRSR